MVQWCRANREFNREINTMDVFQTLQVMIEMMESMMSAIDDLKSQVEATVGAEASAVALIQGIAAELKEALANAGVSDPALTDLTKKLADSSAALGAAVAANSAPVPPPVETPVDPAPVAPEPVVEAPVDPVPDAPAADAADPAA